MNKKTTRAVEIGAGIAAAVAVAGAAGYYFYASTDAKKHRQAASRWATGLKKEVIKQARKLEKLDAKSVARIVDDAAEAYETVRSVKKEDLAAAVRELKANWNLVAVDAMKGGRASARRGRTAKKAVTTVAKRRASKKKSA